ncbi:MAG TPA: zf-TFIIB domain-containing protein [Armatimonadaceae bacterium]|jgi:uncharacterized protein|nr:zf-TFIIB domain-containing protein [Armatimonadaceae bacterium]
MMHCPLCGVSLRTVERLGVELDHCPQCGGLWLDRGELDLLVQQEAVRALTQGQQALQAARDAREYDRAASRSEEATNRYDVDADPMGVADAAQRREKPAAVGADRMTTARFRRARRASSAEEMLSRS